MTGFTNAERLALYTNLRTFESDFDKSQSQIRAISAAWSGVVLGAIALIVINAYTPPNGMGVAEANVRAEMLAALRTVVCLIGSAGVYAFWFIDQRVYQRLLHSVFAYGLFVEFENPDLPQIRSSMFIANLDITNGLAWFYRTQFWMFFVISVVLVFMVSGKVTMTLLLLLGLHALGITFGESYSQKWPSLRELVSTIYGNQGLSGAMPERPDEQSQRATAWRNRITAHPVPEQQAAGPVQHGVQAQGNAVEGA
jgi:hypothetical protein